MKWNTDLPESWDDAPANPPTINRPEVKFKDIPDGYLIRPSDQPSEGTIASNSIHSTVAKDVSEHDWDEWKPKND